jgi:hypothetical protein
MQSHANSYTATAPTGWTFCQVRDQAGRLGARIIEFIDARARAYAAAALYGELSRLSDAELDRRGISRRDLHRCVFEALTRAMSREGRCGARQGGRAPQRNGRDTTEGYGNARTKRNVAHSRPLNGLDHRPAYGRSG